MKVREYKTTINYRFDNSKADQDAAWAILEAMNPFNEETDISKLLENPPQPCNERRDNGWKNG